MLSKDNKVIDLKEIKIVITIEIDKEVRDQCLNRDKSNSKDKFNLKDNNNYNSSQCH